MQKFTINEPPPDSRTTPTPVMDSQIDPAFRTPFMPFPTRVRDDAFIKCARRCCLCFKPSGTKMQLHHIVPAGDGGPDTINNCIPLCLDCHAEVGSYNDRHPIGSKFTSEELRQRRDQCFESVKMTHERLNDSAKSFFPSVRETSNDSIVSGWIEPHYYTAHSGPSVSEIREVFGVKVRNKGSRSFYVDVIGFTIGDKRYPGLFSPFCDPKDDYEWEVRVGQSKEFRFYRATLPDSEDVRSIDGLYLVTGTGDIFVNKADSFERMIQDFIRQAKEAKDDTSPLALPESL